MPRHGIRIEYQTQKTNGPLLVLTNSSTVQQFNSSTVQQFNSSTFQQFNSSTFQQFNISTVQQFNISTVQQFNSSTVQQFNSSTGTTNALAHNFPRNPKCFCFQQSDVRRVYIKQTYIKSDKLLYRIELFYLLYQYRQYTTYTETGCISTVQYCWVISGDMFRPLTGHPQANKE